MKQLDISNQLSIEKENELEWQLFYENMMRSKLLAQILILFEALLILFHVFSSNVVVNIYFYMYIILIIIGLAMLALIAKFEKGDIHDKSRVKNYQKGLYTIVFSFLLWGSILALIDQQDYGNVMAFVINAMCVAVLYHTSPALFIRIFSIPVIVLIGGIPLFQASSGIIMGHYINLFIFLFFCWLASKMLYTSNYRNFSNKVSLEETNEKIEQVVERLKQLSTIDELSQIPNRRGFDEYIQNYIGSSNNTQQLSILIMDIDSFKLYNDCYGHVDGDRVIREVAQQIQACINPSVSVAARYGGEEFIVATFNMSGSDVQQLGERIRFSIERLQISHERSTNSKVVTISLGLATGDITGETDIKLLIERADQMLYKAKRNGRNCMGISAEEFLCI